MFDVRCSSFFLPFAPGTDHFRFMKPSGICLLSEYRTKNKRNFLSPSKRSLPSACTFVTITSWFWSPCYEDFNLIDSRPCRTHRKERTVETWESLLKKALVLRPQDRFLLIDGLVRSLDEPNKEIAAIWADETEKRLKAHRDGKTRGFCDWGSIKDVVKMGCENAKLFSPRP